MSVDLLQEKIRKMKNPSVVDMTADADMIPQVFMDRYGSFLEAYAAYCRNLLDKLMDIVPAVRFRFANFALMGAEGLSALLGLLEYAAAKDYYVLLDCVDVLSPMIARQAAEMLLAQDSPWIFNGLIVSTYIGSDGLKPFAKQLENSNRGLFGVIRTGNKSAPELQDLFTGNRLSHTAAADLVNRLGEPMPAKCGYNRIGAMAGASSADGLRTLRAKYSRVFMILDGYDYPNANAKNCSYAFDRFGHGAVACAGESILAAWKDIEGDRIGYMEAAVEAAERMRKNLNRYVTIL